MKYGMTHKQKKLLEHLKECGDVPPSYEEMKNFMGLKSKSGIHRLIHGLVERGYIEKIPYRSRAIRILP